MRASTAALAALLLAAATARAQEPDLPEPDPDVEQAQLTEPRPVAVAGPGRVVADPATPVVRVQVRVPALLATKAPVKYTIVVTNTSAAIAYKVRVRHPVPANVSGPATFDPAPALQTPTSPPGALPKEVAWTFEELRPGKSHTITAEYPVKPDAASLKAEAFVAFEHGQEVVTTIEKPRLAVDKRAPAEAIAGEPIQVDVVVANPGTVPVEGVTLAESFPAATQFTGEGATAGAAPGQKVWKLGTLRPKEQKLIRYRLTPAAGGEVVTSSAATAAAVPKAVTGESSTKVMVPKLTLALTGPDKADAAAPAEYTLTATNAGTLPLPTVKLTARLPEGCEPAKMSAGGRVEGDKLVWVGPPDRQTAGPLKPNEKYEVKFSLRSATPGERLVRATGDGGRGADGTAEARTNFSGGPVLRGKADIDPGVTRVGEEKTIVYTVTNAGDDAARDVRLVVVLPPEVTLVEAKPKPREAKGEIAFEPTGLLANGQIRYTFTVRGEKPGTARFTFKLSAAGQDRPTESVKEVTVTAKPTEPR